MSQFRMIAKTLKSLEPVLAREIEDLGGQEIEIGRRMVSFVGDKALLYKANLRLRTALRVLKPIYTFKSRTPEELYDRLREFDWESIMTSRHTFAIDTTVYSEAFSHSKYVGYRAKDAIVDYFRDKEGKRPSVRLDAPDIYLNIHIADTEVTLSLDSSGESLHKRGYREAQTDAPLNEVLAAGILLLAGWEGQCDLIDPMCGSGTFLIEAALIARGIAPGVYRQGFAFENWRDYDAALFDELYNDESGERAFEHKIYGSDILRDAVRIARLNVQRAGVARDIELEVLPIQERPKPEQPALIVMNPPYGERLRLTSPEVLYSMIGERFKHNFGGCRAFVLAHKPEHFESIGLRQDVRIELMNGSLDCELRGYELFEGKREDYKRSGRSMELRSGSRGGSRSREVGRGGRAERFDSSARASGMGRDDSSTKSHRGDLRERAQGASVPEGEVLPFTSQGRGRGSRRDSRPVGTDGRALRGAGGETGRGLGRMDGAEHSHYRSERQRSDRREVDGRSSRRDGRILPGGSERASHGVGSGLDRGEHQALGKQTETSSRPKRRVRLGESRPQHQWPSDRFRYRDEVGRDRLKPRPQGNFQVMRSED